MSTTITALRIKEIMEDDLMDTSVFVNVTQSGNNVSPYQIYLSSDNLLGFFNLGLMEDLENYVFEILGLLQETFEIETIYITDDLFDPYLEWDGAFVDTWFEDVELNEVTAPATPAAGKYVIYHDEADSKLKGKDDTGLINEL